jgi:Cysteine-rich secretory protein family
MNRAVIAIVVQMLGMAGVAQAPASSPSVPSPEQELFKLLNAERENAGLEKLRWDDKVAQAAQAHAHKLAANHELSHQFAGEQTLEQRVGAAGARVNAVAENVAVAGNVEEVHLALMNSPGHRDNIMNPRYNAVGISVKAFENKLYVTEDFAHLVPTYSEQQFREALVAAFNRSRQAHHNGPIEPLFDRHLDQQACAGKSDPVELLRSLEGAIRATVFTASQPGDLPQAMEQAAADFTLRRMNLGVCFRDDTKDGFAKFWVVAAFYPSK